MVGEDLIGAGILAFIMGIIGIVLFVSAALYVYMGFAFMQIAKRAKLKTPALSWIPGVGPLIIAYQASKMHWWPWLLLIGFVIPILNFFAIIAFTVYSIIWEWKLFEAVGRPGWWALLSLVPFVGSVVYLILVGIAAWGKK